MTEAGHSPELLQFLKDERLESGCSVAHLAQLKDIEVFQHDQYGACIRMRGTPDPGAKIIAGGTERQLAGLDRTAVSEDVRLQAPAGNSGQVGGTGAGGGRGGDPPCVECALDGDARFALVKFCYKHRSCPLPPQCALGEEVDLLLGVRPPQSSKEEQKDETHVLWSSTRLDQLDADSWTDTFAHAGLTSNVSNIHLLNNSGWGYSSK